MDRTAERQKEIDAAVADIRAIERGEGVTRASLLNIKAAADPARRAHRPVRRRRTSRRPRAGAKRNSCLYRLSEDADHRFALYANASLRRHGTPAHNHTTWAVIVGVTGEELNRFYDRSRGRRRAREGPARWCARARASPSCRRTCIPSTSTRRCSISICTGWRSSSCTGASSTRRKSTRWDVFPAHSDIREARPGRMIEPSPAALRERLLAGGELALLDVREQGVHYRGIRSSPARCRCPGWS